MISGCIYKSILNTSSFLIDDRFKEITSDFFIEMFQNLSIILTTFDEIVEIMYLFILLCRAFS